MVAVAASRMLVQMRGLLDTLYLVIDEKIWASVMARSFMTLRA